MNAEHNDGIEVHPILKLERENGETETYILSDFDIEYDYDEDMHITDCQIVAIELGDDGA